MNKATQFQNLTKIDMSTKDSKTEQPCTIHSVGRSLFCKQYHKRDKNYGVLLVTKMQLDPKRDGNRMDMINELIREGWELCYIHECRNELVYEWLEFTFQRWVD